MSTPPLHILGHLDLGDAFVLNGLVHHISDTEPQIIWYVKPKYVSDVAAMMASNPNVTVAPAGGGYEDPKAKWLTAERTLRLGFFNGGKFHTPRWDSEFYQQAGVPFPVRWNRFSISPDLFPLKIETSPFILVHDDPERNFLINPEMLPASIEIARVRPGKSIWDWMTCIYYAEQIHAIDSSVLNLVESLRNVKAKLFFHRYARKMVPEGANYPTLMKPWTILD